MSGGSLSGGAKRRVGRPRKRVGASLGVTNISASGSGLSGGRRRVGRPKKAGAVSAGRKRTGGASKWISHVKKYASQHGCTYGEALKRARASYKP